MENYRNLGPQEAARNDITMENADFIEMDPTELDHIARQVEWEILTSINTTTAQFGEDDAAQQHIILYTAMEPMIFPPGHEYDISDPIIAQPLFGSPDTSTTASILETPPMPNYELPADWAATWDMNALDMMPAILDFPLDTALDLPTMDDSWLKMELGSAAASEETLQSQLPKAPASSAQINQTTAASPAATNPAADTPSEGFTCSFCPFTATSITKLKTHTNKHTLPFRCTAPGCAYATAEKKSLERHVLAKAKWDEGHRVVAERLGLKGVKYRCTGVGCEYVTIRGDNLRRHVAKCPAMGKGAGGHGK